MTRHYWTADDDDQLDALDALFRLDTERAAKFHHPAYFCQRLIADGVVCHGALSYEADVFGRVITVCGNPRCRHVAFVPRVLAKPDARPCQRCGRMIEGENIAPGVVARNPACRYCNDERNARIRAREQERSRERRRLNPQSERAHTRMETILAMRDDGATLDAIGIAVGLTGERVRQLLVIHAGQPAASSEEAAA